MREIHERPELWPFILLSLILHALFFAAMPWIGLPRTLAGAEEEVVAVELLELDDARLRIADIEKPRVERRPDKTSFLGMYDSSVPEEMVGVRRRPGSMGDPEASPPPREQRKQPHRRAGDLFAFDARLFDGDRRAPPSEKSPGEAGALDDFYPDFRRGARTYLNVLRYPDVAYFVRLKRAFKIAFNPEPSLRAHFSGTQVTRGSVDVVLGVSVDRAGSLAELFIFRSSGMQAYDTEAMRTVRVSAPFAAPPEKFVDDDGLLRMSWTFSVYL